MDAIPHLNLPLQFGGGQYFTVEQDTTAEVAACVAAIVAFPIGYREDEPDFGIPDPAFQTQPVDPAEIEEVVEAYEPRAALTVSASPFNPGDPTGAEVEILVNVIAAED